MSKLNEFVLITQVRDTIIPHYGNILLWEVSNFKYMEGSVYKGKTYMYKRTVKDRLILWYRESFGSVVCIKVRLICMNSLLRDGLILRH